MMGEAPAQHWEEPALGQILTHSNALLVLQRYRHEGFWSCALIKWYRWYEQEKNCYACLGLACLPVSSTNSWWLN